MAEHINRRDLKHDRFVDEMELAYESMRRNTRRIALVALALLVVIAAIVALIAFNRRQETVAQGLLAEAIATMEKPVAGEPGAPADAQFKSADEKLAKVEPLFRRVTEKYEGKDAADVADLYLARIAATRGDVKTAEPKFRAFIEDHPDHLLAGSAQMSLYQIQLGNGQTSELIADVEKQLTAESPVLPKDALLALLARAHEIAGNDAKARDAYQRVINEFPDSAYAMDAQRKVARP